MPTRPAVEEIVTTRPERRARIDRQDGAGHVGRAEQVRLDLRPEVLRSDLLEEPGLEVSGVVYQHVDTAEPLDGGLDGCARGGGIGDVEVDDQQVVVLAQRGRDVVGPACGGDHRVTGGQGRLGDVDAQTAASAGDEPNLLLAHASALLYW